MDSKYSIWNDHSTIMEHKSAGLMQRDESPHTREWQYVLLFE